jgi:hypothetical protein
MDFACGSTPVDNDCIASANLNVVKPGQSAKSIEKHFPFLPGL